MATLHSLTVRMLVMLALVGAGVGSRATELAPEPPEFGAITQVAYEGDIVLEPDAPVAEPIPAPSSSRPFAQPRSVVAGSGGSDRRGWKPSTRFTSVEMPGDVTARL